MKIEKFLKSAQPKSLDDLGRDLTVGIDATNLRQGGGRTHIIELLRAADPVVQGVGRVVVWGGKETLTNLVDRPWLEKVSPSALGGGLLQCSLWQRFSLSAAAGAAGCDILFVPGGNHTAGFHPIVTMSRNMLPFEWPELRRYGWSLVALRLMVLRLIQSRSFRAADGVIFLTDYAKRGVEQVTGPLRGAIARIPHGLSDCFFMPPRPQRPIAHYTAAVPYRLLYVSIVDQYKHQWHLVEGVAHLRQQTGWPLALDLVGPASPMALKRLEASLQRFDPNGIWIRYHGSKPHAELPQVYARADMGVFASSCENMPNILLETMAAGLPVACSNRGPMREILGSAGVYFDPEQPGEIADALQRLIASPELRAELAQASHNKARTFTWERCAEQTFAFLAETCRRYQMNRPTCAA